MDVIAPRTLVPPRSGRFRAGLACVACLWLPTPVLAEGVNTGTTTQSTATVTTPVGESVQTQARRWALTEAEWLRYEALMRGMRGSVSHPGISPVEVLGIHARNAHERRRYAEQWAMMMQADAERILAFQRAYDTAAQRLFGATPLIDAARLPARPPADPELAQTDRLLLFTRANCAPCDAALAAALDRLDRIAGLDLYLSDTDPGDEAAIRRWAGEHGINAEWVKSRRVTLNFEAGALARIAPGDPALPYLVRRRGESLEPFPASAL